MVDWAKSVVASHPDHNVIVVTHDYIDGARQPGARTAGYGDTSPQYLFDNLISQYPNIKMTVSGHVGCAGDKVYTGKNGNKIYSFLTTIHSGTTNPVRLVTVDTKAGTLKTWIYAPFTNETFTGTTARRSPESTSSAKPRSTALNARRPWSRQTAGASSSWPRGARARTLGCWHSLGVSANVGLAL